MKKSLGVLIFMLLVLLVKAQSRDEIIMVKELDLTTNEFNSRKVEYLFKNHKNIIIKYNPISLFFGGMMYVYQKHISQVLGSSCPYEHSCSAFSVMCIKEFGLLKGVALTADRFTRCTSTAARDITEININPKTDKIIDQLEWYN